MKKFYFPLLTCLAFFFFFTACDDDEELENETIVDTTPEIYPSEVNLSFDIAGGSQSVTIYSEKGWTVDNDYASWVSVSPTSGSDETQVSFTVEANATDGVAGDVRATSVYFRTTTEYTFVTIVQSGNSTFSFSPSSLSFGVGGGSQTVTVNTDATEWTVDCPDWLTVSPTSGTSGESEITVTASENHTAGTISKLREGEISFIVQSLVVGGVLSVDQDGDNYSEVSTIDEVYNMTDGDVLYLSDVLVTVIGIDGYIITDDTDNIFVYGEEVAIGDKISIFGVKSTENDLAVINAEFVDTSSTENTVNYPTPVEITNSYSSTKWDYVCASGVYLGSDIEITDSDYTVTVVHTLESIVPGDYHSVTLNGYYAGTVGFTPTMIGASLSDSGEVDYDFFFDDFQWLEPWYEACKATGTTATDPVADNNAGTYPNFWAANVDGLTTYQEFLNRGYVGFCLNSGDRDGTRDNTVSRNISDGYYIQASFYMKCGWNGGHYGIYLPIVEGVPEDTPLHLAYDWCPARDSGGVDGTELDVRIINGSEYVLLQPGPHGITDSDKLKWIHIDLDLSNYTVNAGTKIFIYPDGIGNSVKKQRYYIDNIEIYRKASN